MAEVLAVRATITKIFEGYSANAGDEGERTIAPAHRQEGGECVRS